MLFIHSSIGGHLGCVYFLAVVNNAAMNMHEQIREFPFSILWSVSLGVELLGHTVAPF